MNDNSFNWNAAAFFERLTKANKLAKQHNFTFGRVSSLEGFHSLISSALASKAFVAVSDTSSGGLDLDNSPHTRRIKTVFLFMRHKVDDDAAHQLALDRMNELFRQFMSVLIQEKTRLRENSIYLDSRISFQEIDKYFYTGGACAFFNIAVDTYTDLVYNPDEWLSEIL